MNCKNLIVTTIGGFICRFEENKSNGDWLAKCYDGSSNFYNKTVVRESVKTLKKGNFLEFEYFTSYGVKKFKSSTPIVSICS